MQTNKYFLLSKEISNNDNPNTTMFASNAPRESEICQGENAINALANVAAFLENNTRASKYTTGIDNAAKIAFGRRVENSDSPSAPITGIEKKEYKGSLSSPKDFRLTRKSLYQGTDHSSMPVLRRE
jgi:hypothetical protein